MISKLASFFCFCLTFVVIIQPCLNRPIYQNHSQGSLLKRYRNKVEKVDFNYWSLLASNFRSISIFFIFFFASFLLSLSKHASTIKATKAIKIGCKVSQTHFKSTLEAKETVKEHSGRIWRPFEDLAPVFGQVKAWCEYLSLKKKILDTFETPSFSCWEVCIAIWGIEMILMK